MPETTKELETIKKEIADVSTFVKEHVEPVQEERVRLRKAIESLTTEQREYRRASVLNDRASSGDARVVRSGPYAGCDELDLVIMRSVQRAAESQLGTESVRDWDVRLKAAMDSVTPSRGDELVPTGHGGAAVGRRPPRDAGRESVQSDRNADEPVRHSAPTRRCELVSGFREHGSYGEHSQDGKADPHGV